MSVFEKVAEMIGNYKECETETVAMESTWSDLELDSLDTVELIMNMENEFGVSIEMSEDLQTVGDVVTLIEAQLK
jgi:acyl carrier protein